MAKWQIALDFGIRLAAIGLAILVVLPWIRAGMRLPESFAAWLAVLENLAHWLGLAALPILVLALFRHQYAAAAIAAGAFVFVGVAIISAYPSGPTKTASAPPIRVIAANLWFLNAQHQDIIAYLRASGVDIVLLSEASAAHKQALAALSDLYPTRIACETPSLSCEEMILSRFPATDGNVGKPRGRMPAIAEAKLRTPFGFITVIAAHVTQPFPRAGRHEQKAQLENLADHIAATDGPVILGGDFNAAPWTYEIRRFKTQTGLQNESWPLGSWPVRWHGEISLPALLRLPVDHVLAGRGLQVAQASLGARIGSDHLPILAEIVPAP